jgi:hypothetical protein
VKARKLGHSECAEKNKTTNLQQSGGTHEGNDTELNLVERGGTGVGGGGNGGTSVGSNTPAGAGGGRGNGDSPGGGGGSNRLAGGRAGRLPVTPGHRRGGGGNHRLGAGGAGGPVGPCALSWQGC